MSSRPECNFCYERISMGTCACGNPRFGELSKEEKKAQKKWFKERNIRFK